MARGSSKGSARSAITGRYVTKATAARHPRTTVVNYGSHKGSGTAYRSAITGKYVTKGTAQRHPNNTVTENG